MRKGGPAPGTPAGTGTGTGTGTRGTVYEVDVVEKSCGILRNGIFRWSNAVFWCQLVFWESCNKTHAQVEVVEGRCGVRSVPVATC